MSYLLGQEAVETICRSTGLTMSELDVLDFDEEISLVQSIRGDAPVFPSCVDDRLVPRGSMYLGEGRFLSSEEIELELDRMYACYA